MAQVNRKMNSETVYSIWSRIKTGKKIDAAMRNKSIKLYTVHTKYIMLG